MNPDAEVIAFIGGGNMARSLIGGLRSSKHPARAIHASDPDPAIRHALHADFGIVVHEDNAAAAAAAATWVLAVKPQLMARVCVPLRTLAERQAPCVLSVAAGLRCAQLQRWLGPAARIIRSMPNTPALLGCGASGLYASPQASQADRALAERLLGSVGLTRWIEDESLMDAVTALSGSGPAYVFLFTELLARAGQQHGLPAETAEALAVQTVIGAARMLAESGEDAATLRQRVTSPGGTTAAALARLAELGLDRVLFEALAAATERGRALARMLDAEPT